MMSDHPSCRESIADEAECPLQLFSFPVNLNENSIHRMPLQNGNNRMRRDATSVISSRVEPALTAPPEASPKQTGRSTSPEKKGESLGKPQLLLVMRMKRKPVEFYDSLVESLQIM
jgi:hypothetical protein